MELWDVEWPNINANRRYPLAEGTTITAGDFVLPDDLIVDMVLGVPTDTNDQYDPARFFVSQVGVFSGGITISLAYSGTTTETIGTINIDRSTFEPYSTFRLAGTGSFSDSAGWMTIGQINTTLRSPGAWSFTLGATRIHPCCIRPDIRTVTSISVRDISGRSVKLTGDVFLQSGSNHAIEVNGNTIRLSAVSGDGLSDECDCYSTVGLDESKAACIRTINGVGPDPDTGAINLTPGSYCVEITPNAGEHSVEITDKCSEPCCDCVELNVLNEAIDAVTKQAAQLGTGVDRLLREVSNTKTVLAASAAYGSNRYQ